MKSQFWVVGGEYEDMDFLRLAKNASEQKYGPFANYTDALKEWKRLAWQTVDQALMRFYIQEISEAKKYWVVGGEYRDASFTELAGQQEQYGPFADYQTAHLEWAKFAWLSVDKALYRYWIVEESKNLTS